MRVDVTVEQDRLIPAIEGLGGSVESRMQSAQNGMRVTIDSKRLGDLETLDGVKGVHAIPQYEQATMVSVPYIGVPVAWQGNGFAHGYTGTSIPTPDDNPIDCDASRGTPADNGTHVAGDAAGSRVFADGSTYTGSYGETTHTNNEFMVGLGVAPAVDIYALWVFGCSGTTDLVTEGIDWVIAKHMDGVSLSLGSSDGRADSCRCRRGLQCCRGRDRCRHGTRERRFRAVPHRVSRNRCWSGLGGGQ